MSRKKLARFSVLLVALVLLASVVAVMPPSGIAYAGSNGQQIYFSCRTPIYGFPTMNYAVIKGTNQYGRPAMWEGPARWQGSYWSTYVFTSGWWWVGNVRIYWRAGNGVWNSMQVLCSQTTERGHNLL